MILLLWILIQIIGESLPISSSGHVELMQKYFHVSLQNLEQINFLLHGPAILIVLIYFFSTWWKMIFSKKTFQIPWRPMFFVGIADIITFVFWKLEFFKLNCIQNYFLPFGFFITCCCLYFSKYFQSKKVNLWSMRDAIVLGTVQGICLFPGISRFAGTYTTGLFLGYDRKTAVVLSFLIQFPLLCAAFTKEFVVMHHDVQLWNNLMQPWTILAIMIATVISYVMFCWVIRLIEQNKLWYFSFYMILPISVSWLLMVKDIML